MFVRAQFDPELSSRQFGVELSRLTSDERAVPLVVEKLINYIEMHGLYTEGIYRKSGSTNKIKELKQGLDTGELHCERHLMVKCIQVETLIDDIVCLHRRCEQCEFRRLQHPCDRECPETVAA